jgi:hypothetical protein
VPHSCISDHFIAPSFDGHGDLADGAATHGTSSGIS